MSVPRIPPIDHRLPTPSIPLATGFINTLLETDNG